MTPTSPITHSLFLAFAAMGALATGCIDDPNPLGSEQTGGRGSSGGQSLANTGGNPASGAPLEGGVSTAGPPPEGGASVEWPLPEGGASVEWPEGGASAAGAPLVGGASSTTDLTLDTETLTFFDLPINSIRHAVSGYDPEARICAVIVFDFSNTGRSEGRYCDAFGDMFPYVTLLEDQDEPCGDSVWSYWGATPEEVSGCYASDVPTIHLDLTIDWEGTMYNIAVANEPTPGPTCQAWEDAGLEEAYIGLFAAAPPTNIESHVQGIADPSTVSLSEGCNMRVLGPVATGTHGIAYNFSSSGALIGFGAWDDVPWGPCSVYEYRKRFAPTFSRYSVATVPGCDTVVSCTLDTAVAGVHCP